LSFYQANDYTGASWHCIQNIGEPDLDFIDFANEKPDQQDRPALDTLFAENRET